MKKRLLMISAMMIGCVMLIWMLLPEQSMKKRLANSTKFTYYLDKGNAEISKKMQAQDLVIIEPIEMQAQYITDAQQAGTMVYGYINTLEADRWNHAFYEQLKEEDFYHNAKGERLYFEKWDSYATTMTSPHYQELLLAEVEKQVVRKKLDGVFLDTVGNIEDYLPQEEQVVQQKAMQAFMAKLKERYPDLGIGQNWGFETLQNYTAPYVDFVLWEDFSYDKIAHDDWAQQMIAKLETLREEHALQILTIGFSEPQKSAELAKKHSFLFYYRAQGSYYNTW